MSKYEIFLEPGEEVGEIETHSSDGSSFDTVQVQTPSLADGSRVLLDIRTRTDRNVLIGGNPLYISTLKGLGRISIIELKNGSHRDVFMEPGTRAIIPSNNVLYWYDNLSDLEDFIVEDTCPNFDQTHEPNLKAVAEALTGLHSR